MSLQAFDEVLLQELSSLTTQGLFKKERIITSPQAAEITTANGKKVLNFCSNNYLGLSSHPRVLEAAKKALDTHGFGMSSVRFICGTQDLHKELEARIASFVGAEDAILYAAAFDANGGLFEPLLGEEDAIISDSLNHASIIDGIRLCKSKRYRYANNDMNDLEDKLKEARTQGARRIMIATDGVFSMDGIIASMDEVVALGEKYDALVMVDDCHAVGFVGKRGRGSCEHAGVFGQQAITTGTFGKALGGASGGYTASSKPVIEMLRQKSRPYLFSNTLAPAIVGASIEVLDILESSCELRDTLEANAAFFRKKMGELGFDIIPGTHPIVPLMIYDAAQAQRFADELLKEGVYVIGFFYPVVPKDKARIRVQISASHSQENLQSAIDIFEKVGRRLGLI
jgi:glycine C-acetyltransferase